jgi:TPR repeat protein
VELGKLCVSGTGVNEDFAKARRLFKNACDAKEPRGCSNLAAMVELGRGADADEVAAYELYANALSLHAQACEIRRQHSACCQEAWHYEYGKGTKASSARARSLYGRCCEAGVQLGCDREKALR